MAQNATQKVSCVFARVTAARKELLQALEAQRALDAEDREAAKTAYPVQAILAAVAAAHGLTVQHIYGRNRTKKVSYARHHAVWELRRRRHDLRLVDVAAALHRTDHTTGINGYRRFAAVIKAGHYVVERLQVNQTLGGGA